MQRRSIVVLFVLPVFFLSLALTALVGPTTVSRADDGCQTFQETGFKVCGRFLQYWQSSGGLTQQGLPISDVFVETNAAPPAGDGKPHKVQYFQRARFEYHDENQPPFDVLLGLLGTEQLGAKYKTISNPTPTRAAGCQTFQDTGFEVCGRFLDYWNGHGGLSQEGLPISSVIEEENAPPPAGDGKVHRVQYFQRARFEQHDENASPYDVLLGLLGGEQFGTKYTGVTITPVAPPPALPTNPTPGPTPAPTPAPQPAPASGVTFVSVQGASPGNVASAIVQTAPTVSCSISYTTPKGTVSKAAGLVDKTSDGSGRVSWSWLIGGNTTRGTGSVTVSCRGQRRPA